MPTTRRRITRAPSSARVSEAALVLECGRDLLGDFREAGAEEELCDIWNDVRDEVMEQHLAQDCSTRPMGWWWFDAPRRIRLKVFSTHLPSEQRKILLAARVLDGEAARLARERVAAQRASSLPMAFFDFAQPGPRIEL